MVVKAALFAIAAYLLAQKFFIWKTNTTSISNKMTKYQPVTHVIFDIDGLILDTESIYEKIMSQIAKKYDKVYTNEIKSKVLGTNEEIVAATIIAELELPLTTEAFLTELHTLQVQLVDCALMPGAEKLIRHLHKKKIPMAVATSSGKDSVAIKTKKYKKLFGLFHHLVSGTSDPEVKNGKPAPDIFQVCASRFDGKPSSDKCLVFEDAPNGVTAAKAAGMQVVMVPDKNLPTEKTSEATQVVLSLMNFKPEDFGLPPY